MKSASNKKTIIVLASTYPRWKDDPEPQFIHELCKRLTNQFHVIAVVPDAQNSAPNEMLDGVEIIRYRYAPKKLQSLVNNGGIINNLKAYPWKWLLVPGFIIGQYLALRKILKIRKVDLIHAHWLIPQGFIARTLAHKNNISFIVTSHGGDLYGLKGKQLTQIKKTVAESSTAMTVVSSAMTTYLSEQNIHPRILKVIPMGIDFNNRFSIQTTFQRNSHEILFVGRLVPKKGLNLLLEAISLLTYRYPELSLKIVGFGPEEKNLKSLVKQLKIENHVQFLGALSQDQLPPFYQSATVFVAPFIRANNGDQEGLPVALMEAIGCACPIIAGQVAGLEDLLGDELQQSTVNPKNIQSLASAITDVFENSKEAQARSERIRLRSISFIDWENVSQRYAKLIHSCIEHS